MSDTLPRDAPRSSVAVGWCSASGAADAGAMRAASAGARPTVSAEVATEIDALVASGHFERKPGACANCRRPGLRSRPVPLTGCTHDVMCVECHDSLLADCDGDLELAAVLGLSMCSECERAAAGKRPAP